MRVLRAEIGLSSKETAERIGVHPVTYSEYEAGKMMPSGAILQRIAEVFGCSADEIDLTQDDNTVEGRSVVSEKARGAA